MANFQAGVALTTPVESSVSLDEGYNEIFEIAGEAIFKFDQDLVVQNHFSSICVKFFGSSPANQDAARLLFGQQPDHVDLFRSVVSDVLSSGDSNTQKVLLSLLPDSIELNGRTLSLRFEVLKSNQLAVILRDITHERILAANLDKKLAEFSMVVAAMVDGPDFFDNLNSFESFLNKQVDSILDKKNEQAALAELYRQVHTYKSSFEQFSFINLPLLLHEIESALNHLRKDAADSSNLSADKIRQSLDLGSIKENLRADLLIVRDYLGQEFLSKGSTTSLITSKVKMLQRLAASIRYNAEGKLTRDVNELVMQIERMGALRLNQSIFKYEKVLKQVSKRLEKEVLPIEVHGGADVLLDPNRFGPFLKSLIHIFRNSITHGIEAPDIRIKAGKNPEGQITCKVNYDEQNLYINLSDDGAGINPEVLKVRAIECGAFDNIDINSLKDDEVLDLIFSDFLSTSKNVDQLAGRGVGLSAVREKVSKLGGKIVVNSELSKGSTFTITIPRDNSVQIDKSALFYK